MRIAVVGAGGIGAFFGACLQRAGHEVGFVVTERHVGPIVDHGLRVTTDREDFVVRPAAATTQAGDIGPVDAVIVAVKTYQLGDVLAGLPALVGPETVVLTLQNGVTAGPRLRSALDGAHVIPGLAVIVAYLERPGHVRQVGGRTGIIMAPTPLPGPDDTAASDDPTVSADPTQRGPAGRRSSAPDLRVQGLTQALSEAGVRAEISQDIDRDLWRKFALITAFGGVGTLTHSTIGEYATWEPTRALLVQALHEVKALANARGVRLTDHDLRQVLAQLDSLPPDSTSSMQRDLMAGHASELEDQNGTVVRLAAESGVPVPLHTVIYRVLSLYQHRGRV